MRGELGGKLVNIWWHPLSKRVWGQMTASRDASPTAPSKLNQNFEPITAIVEAYPQTPSIQSTLMVLVTTLFLFSLIITSISFTHSSLTIKTIINADFWQLIFSSIMQILSLLSMMILIHWNARLAKKAWVWTWVLAECSACCAVVVMSLYLYLSTKWSGAVSFAETVAQSYVTLQLIYALW